MTTVLKRLWTDERGFIVSAEIVLIVTIGVLGVIVGISSVATTINNELNDVSSAFGAVDQSYWYSGQVKLGHAGVTGSGYADAQDFCDCTTIVRTVPGVKIQTGSSGLLPPPITPPVVSPPPAPPSGPCDTGPCPKGGAPGFDSPPKPHAHPHPHTGIGRIMAPESFSHPVPPPCPPAYRAVPCPVPFAPHHHHGHPQKAPRDKVGPRLKPHPEPKFQRRKR